MPGVKFMNHFTDLKNPLLKLSEETCCHCSLFRVSFTVLSLKNLYSLCKNEVPFGVSVNQQIFIKTNQ